MHRLVVSAVVYLSLAFSSALALAGHIYEIEVQHEGQTKHYSVQFGGGERMDSWTAFDPESQQFVYLKFPRGEAGPQPVATIWDSRTGETISLYKFDGAKHLLPRIESLKQLQVCPFTGSKELKVVATIVID
jgi:hypothetical protein